MAHIAQYWVHISGDDQGRVDASVNVTPLNLDYAQTLERHLDASGYDVYITAELVECDENMMANQMIIGGWGDHCFGELFRVATHDKGYDYKKCLFYKGHDAAQNIPLAYLDRVSQHDMTPTWRLLPDGIQHYLENYMERGPLDESLTNHLRALSSLRADWLDGYETRRL